MFLEDLVKVGGALLGVCLASLGYTAPSTKQSSVNIICKSKIIRQYNYKRGFSVTEAYWSITTGVTGQWGNAYLSSWAMAAICSTRS